MKRGNVMFVIAAALLSVGAPRAVAQGGVNMGEWGLRAAAMESPMPAYPEASLGARISGVVVAAVLFGVDGKLASIDILQSPDAHTGAAVRDAVGRWTVPGVQVMGREEKSPVRGKLTFYFQLRDGKGVVLSPDQMPGGPARPTPRAPASGRSGPPAAAPAVNEHHATPRSTTVADFKKQAPGAIVLDVGAREAFRRGHWPGAVNIPADEIAIRAAIELPREKAIVIDCTQEQRFYCDVAAWGLADLKFKDVVLLVR
jgi:rhodanese-related sulfurtransferase